MGPRNPKPTNQVPRSFRPPESEHAKAHKDIEQKKTLIDRRKQLDQCSRCGNAGNFCRKCPATHPVVAWAKLSRKQTSDQTGHRERPPVPKARRLEAPPPSVKRVDAEIRGSGPQILEVDTDMSDG